jgi:hypothetical protein
MGRGYHLIPKIAIQEISNNTSIKVVKYKEEGNEGYFLQDIYKNTCWLNMSTVYSDEEEMASVFVGVLDFYGSNNERYILSELFNKLGVMFYNDSMIWECLHEGGCIKRGGVIEFMRNVLGTSIIGDDFQNEKLEEILVEFEIEEEANNSMEVENNDEIQS